MQMTGPAYSDGTVKAKQTKFGGLNFNVGAGDGELYSMQNLCSDDYPVMATRPKRKKIRTLTKANGLYAWNKLCWVDGTKFYYDGVEKGTVTDGKKRFAAINDMIIILPDMKYYDTVEDVFGDLEAKVSAQEAGEALSVNTAPVTTDVFGSAMETKFLWTNELPQRNYSSGGSWVEPDLIVRSGGGNSSSVTFTEDTMQFANISIGNLTTLATHIGEKVYIFNCEERFNNGAKKLLAVDMDTGIIGFEPGSFKPGTYIHGDGGTVDDIHVGSNNWISIYACDVKKIYVRHPSQQDYTRINPNTTFGVETLQVGDEVIVSIPGYDDEVVHIESFDMRGANPDYRIGYRTDEVLIEGATIEVTDLMTIRAFTVPAVVFSDGNTITCTGIDWSEHVSEGDTLEIIDSSFEITNDNNETETVSNDGVYKVVSVSGSSVTVDGTLINGTDTSSKAYALGDTGIHFKATEPSAVLFGEDSLYCKGVTWSFADGEYISVAGCGISENNKSLMLRDTDGAELSFDEDSFTAGVDKDGITVTRVHAHPFEFRDGTIYGEPAEANTIYCNSVTWSDYFRPGDVVTIRNCSIEANNKSLIVREVEGHELRFYENSFSVGVDTGAEISISRDVPELEFAFENDNRLWGCKGNVIYASKLGDPFNFNVFDGLDTDSFTVDTSSCGSFSGAIAFGGYPSFFKDQDIYKIYGNKPSNYEVVRVAYTGVEPTSGDSMAIAGEALFYLNRNGICMYTGSLPRLIGSAFGKLKFRSAVAGSDGVRYYVSMPSVTDGTEEEYHLYVYDTQKGLWHEEDHSHIEAFAYLDGVLYALYHNGDLYALRWGTTVPEGTDEEDFDWEATFSDFTDDSPNVKDLVKIQIRMELENNASCNIRVMYDGDGTWITPVTGTIQEEGKRSYVVAFVIRRADYYRIRLEGRGGCRIYSLSRSVRDAGEQKNPVTRL